MKYIDYKNMKYFYTIAEVCRLFEMEMMELQRYSEKYKIHPQEDQYGNWGFRKQMVRKLHNYIYKEQRNQPDNRQNDPWRDNSSERKRGPWD